MSELFLEIRCEELPARFVGPAIDSLEAGTRALLKGLTHGEVRTWATPRRLAIAVADLAEARAEEEKLVTGPPEASAYKDGKPTPAAEGFARKFGVEVSALEIIDGPKGRVLAARQKAGGARTVDLIAAGLEGLVLGIPFAKSMRWGSSKVRWGRPFHGVIALFGGARIQATVAHLSTTDTTIGHRLTPEPVVVADSASWLAAMSGHNVEPDRAIRRARIVSELAERAAELGASIPDMPDLVDEVVNLVEWPVVVVGTISTELLHLPPRLLVESMKVHQRVFPLFKDGALDHHFLVVTNQPFARDPEVAALIGEGNARVLRARFHDARHFYAEDQKRRLEDRWTSLQGMGWIRNGGTMADKVTRLVEIAGELAALFGADEGLTRRAALLCKADLATLMVGEFPELQGHVGRLLAAFQGEEPATSMAIEEHYLPRFADDALPSTPEGRALALADRVDSLAGCFALDQKPKGSADPLGLRRAANGLLQILLSGGVRVQLGDLFTIGLRHCNVSAPAAAERARDELVDFVIARLRAQLQEHAATEYVDAVLASGDQDPVALSKRLGALVALSRTDGFGALKTTFKRVLGLTRDVAAAGYDPDALTEPAELALHTALLGASADAETYAAELDYASALSALAGLKAPVDALFDQVMVMADDKDVRARRLGLLKAVATAFRQVADFTHLSAEG